MKKDNIYKILYIVSVLLIVVFAIMIGIDYLNYNTYINSAPFYVRILERSIEFVIPSIIVFGIAMIIKKKI